MQNIKILQCLFYLSFLGFIKADQLTPEEIGQVDYIKVVPQSPQNFEFSYFKYMDETGNYSSVYDSFIEGCKLSKNKLQNLIRYQLNDDTQSIILEGEKQIQSEEFFIKIPIINAIKKNLFIKPFCAQNQIELYIYNFDHDIDRNIRIIRLQRVVNKFKQSLYSGYRYDLIDINLNNGNMEEHTNLRQNVICKPAKDFEFKKPFKFEFFMIEGDGRITSRIKKQINPQQGLNLLPSFINSFENLVPHCFQYQNNNNYKLVLRNLKSRKQGKEHEDHSLFQMVVKTEGNQVFGQIFKVDDENRAEIVTQCQLEVEYLDQFKIIELKYIVLNAKNLYTEFSEIERENENMDLEDSIHIGTQYYKNFDPEKYDCKIHFTKKEQENKAFGFLFYKEMYRDIDEYTKEEKDKQIEKVDYDDLLNKMNLQISKTLIEQAETEKLIDEEEQKLSKVGVFNDLMDEYSEEQDSEKESESVQVDQQMINAEKQKEEIDQQKRMTVVDMLSKDLQPSMTEGQDLNVRRIRQFSSSDKSEEFDSNKMNEIQYVQNNFFMKEEDINLKPTKLEDVKNDISYYKRANVSDDSDEININRLNKFNDKYNIPMQKAKNAMQKKFSEGSQQVEQRFYNTKRNSIQQRGRAVPPKKDKSSITNIIAIPQQKKVSITNITKMPIENLISPTNIAFGAFREFQARKPNQLLQAQQNLYKNYKEQKSVERDSFNGPMAEPEVASEDMQIPIQLKNFAKQQMMPKEIIINMNDYLGSDADYITRDFVRQKVIELKNEQQNEREFRQNRFKTVSKNKDNVFEAISKKVREKYLSIRRDIVNKNSKYMKPLGLKNPLAQVLQNKFEPLTKTYYNLHIIDKKLYFKQNHTTESNEKLIDYECQPFLEHQVNFLEAMQDYQINEVQIQWINESKVFKRTVEWSQDENGIFGNWQEQKRFLETEILLKSRLSIEKQKCVYKIHKRFLEIIFVKDYLNVTQHTVYQENTTLHYVIKNLHTNGIIKACQEQIIGMEKLPVISAYQTDEFGITRESKYNLYYSHGNLKTFITQNIDNNLINNQNSFCVVDKTYYKHKKRVALRTFRIPATQTFQFVEAYFYKKEISIFEVFYNGTPYHKTTHHNFEQKLQNADLDTLFFMVNTFVNQNIVSQTNLVNKGYRIRLPYLSLTKYQQKRDVHVRVNTSKNNHFAFIYLQPKQKNLQVIRTAIFQTSNQQLNYIMVNDHNQNTIKANIEREYSQNELIHNSQINNEFFYYTNQIVVNSTRFSGEKKMYLHQNAIRLQEGFFMETYFIQALPENNQIILKDAKVNVQGSKITIKQNLLTLDLI